MEYEFELNGRSLAGLPALQGQYSGVQYGGRVRVQGLTTDTAIIRVSCLANFPPVSGHSPELARFGTVTLAFFPLAAGEDVLVRPARPHAVWLVERRAPG